VTPNPPFYGDYYELAYVPECPECGAPMYESPCGNCIEADYMDEMAA
jgi:hypothetical protein